MERTEKQLQDNDKWSGTIELINEEIVFKCQGKELNRLSLTNIKVIGEMTTVADPMANDWFIIFVDNKNVPHYIPAYANNWQNFQKQLGAKLGLEIVGKLFGSVDFDSNVLYPTELAGHKLFDFNDAKANNIWEKIRMILGFGKPITAELTKEILNYN